MRQLSERTLVAILCAAALTIFLLAALWMAVAGSFINTLMEQRP